jgi:hypothetical protein
MPAPLDDVVVLEIDNWMAAPSAGAVLADMGARVIKIEPITGDPMRGMGRPVKGERVAEALQDYDFQFDVDNRGKESIAVALDQPEGAELVRQNWPRKPTSLCATCSPNVSKSLAWTQKVFSKQTQNWFTPLSPATAPRAQTLGGPATT